MEIYNFISLFGIVVLFVLGWLLSANRKAINWHIVVWAIGFQFLFAWFLFVLPAGVKVFWWINDVVISVINSSLAGSKFLFGPLAVAPGQTGTNGEASIGFIFAFQVLPSVIFFSALMALLYYWRIMPVIIKFFARIFTKLMNVSGAEALCTASNIFVGIESAFTIRPFLKKMTKSEFCTILTAGMSTVASNVLVLYVFTLKDIFPNIAGHLISASLLSAPAALAFSKVLLPEEGHPETLGENIDVHVEKSEGFFEAIMQGSQAGVKLIVGIAALLIAVLGLVALLDQGFLFGGGHLNQLFAWNIDWSLSNLLGIIFYPLTIILGLPLNEAGVISQIIGERLVLTEVVSYQHLAQAVKDGLIKDPRSVVIASYALCGFAHVASMSIFVGGIAALVPERTRDISQVALRALLASTLACLLTACVAGVFYINQGMVLNI